MAAALGVELEAVTDRKVGASEEMVEMLTSPLWKKKLVEQYRVVARGGKGLRLAGLPSSIDAAAEFIAGFGPVALRRMDLSDEDQGCSLGKGATILMLQERTGCSLEIKKPGGKLAVIGRRPLSPAVDEINELLQQQARTPRGGARAAANAGGRGGAGGGGGSRRPVP